MSFGSGFKTLEEELRYYFNRVGEYNEEIAETLAEYKDYQKSVTNTEIELKGYIYELKKKMTENNDVLTEVSLENQNLKKNYAGMENSNSRE